jgi:hypothetical protein
MNGSSVEEFEVMRPEIGKLSPLFGVGVICLLHLGAQHHAWAAPHLVTVRGQAHLTNEVRRDADRVVIRGTLVDDADEPVANAELSLSLSHSSTTLTTCNEQRGPSRGKVRTSDRGQFCVSTPGDLERTTVLRLSFAGSEWVDGTAKEVELGRAHRTLQLRPESSAIRATAGAPVSIVVTAHEGSVSTSGVKVALTGEQGESIGQAETDAAGKATIDVTNSGAPGTGIWVVRTEGDDVWFPAETRLTTTRTTAATLTTRQPTTRIWDQTGTESLVVDVACRFPVSGEAELWLGGERLGSGPIRNNAATIPFEASNLSSRTAQAEVRLKPTSEHVLAAPLAVTLDTRPRQALHAIGILGGLAVLGVLAFGRSAALRRRFQQALRRRWVRIRAQPTSVGSGNTMDALRHRGRIVDSYSGKPINGAQIRSIDVTFSENTERACARSSHQGEFEVCPTTHQARWEIAAAGYRTREVTNAELSLVRLQKSKHALVEDLVDWARAIGSPFDQKPEPTPGHIAKVARQVGKTAAWARAVETAAFSPEDIDEARAEDIRRTRPLAIPAADDPGEDVR